MTEQISLDLSEQKVLQCSGAGSCNGGVPQDAITQITLNGLPFESSYPYTASDTTESKCSGLTVKKLLRPIQSINHYSSLTQAQLQQFLITNGPVLVGVSAGNTAFMEYASGIFTGCQAGASIDHSVLLVGFTAAGDWIIKNSWGLDWG